LPALVAVPFDPQEEVEIADLRGAVRVGCRTDRVNDFLQLAGRPGP
jgi:hypothetical protein